VVRYNSNTHHFHSSILEKWEYHPILQWDQLSKKFPWGIFMLQGAGLAIADGFKVISNKNVFPKKKLIITLGIISIGYNRYFS
jgi:hypothetical protein